MAEVAQKELSADEIKAEADRLKAEKQRAIILSEVVKSWNTFIRGLILARKGWGDYRAARMDNGVHVEEFPIEIQKMFTLANPKGEFSLLVDDIVIHPKLHEYLKTLLIPIK